MAVATWDFGRIAVTEAAKYLQTGKVRPGVCTHVSLYPVECLQQGTNVWCMQRWQGKNGVVLVV